MRRRLAASIVVVAVVAACAPAAPPRFPLRAPLTIDTDTRPVWVPCRPDPGKDDPRRVTCAPVEYFSPFKWDRIDNLSFGPLSRLLSVDVAGEAANANSLDEVADSAWFENRIGARALDAAQLAAGACRPADLLPDDVADGAWVIDHGKDNGATPGFRITVPGKGAYLLKAEETRKPERASAASVIGAAIYHAAGFAISCEQIVMVRPAQLTLTPGLVTHDNEGASHPFDQRALDAVLASSTHVGDRVRLEASKWLPGVPLGPFRYEGTRADDPNDVIPHQDRRELRGSRLLAAWLGHWDAREQNSMDLWLAADPAHKRSSPGYVRHYLLDTSDCFGQTIDPFPLEARLGFSYVVDVGDILIDFVTLGAREAPWDRAHPAPGHEIFGLYRADDFDAEAWKGMYPNPAFVRMSERDGAWMARIIARFSPDDLRTIVAAGELSDPGNADYLLQVLRARQDRILARYLTRLSPLADVRARGDQLCAIDLARLRGVVPAARFRYRAIERDARGREIALATTIGPDGEVCVTPRTMIAAGATLADDDPARVVVLELDNGTGAGALHIHTYDLGDRGLRVVGLVRPEP